MPRRSNNSFDCKLNQNYKAALRWTKPKKKEKTVTLYEITSYFGYTLGEALDIHPEEVWRRWYEEEQEEDNDWEEEGNYGQGMTNCCGIDELNFLDQIENINKNTPEVRYLVAKVIKSCDNDDKRILFVGLPLRKHHGGDTMYNFKNYAVLRKILLDFGFKQAHKRLYKNNNSENMLSVLVGQMP